ncbi:hypothetical protein Csa_020204 [Cucumis sativus]|uniref:Uncharacterized protein n=1 Tax=Cucumis sativus TaxID=3659 RepID=A0A0A0K2E2_CUCSA|nr:hypothetical protein Csa_020204 [Cucumis sativus]
MKIGVLSGGRSSSSPWRERNFIEIEREIAGVFSGFPPENLFKALPQEVLLTTVKCPLSSMKSRCFTFERFIEWVIDRGCDWSSVFVAV